MQYHGHIIAWGRNVESMVDEAVIADEVQRRRIDECAVVIQGERAVLGTLHQNSLEVVAVQVHVVCEDADRGLYVYRFIVWARVVVGICSWPVVGDVDGNRRKVAVESAVIRFDGER